MLDIREVNARPLAARRTTTTTTAPHSRHTAGMNESDDPMPDERLRVVCLCADWCGVCRDYRATFDSASATFGARAEFSWIDIEDDAALLDDVDVENFPTLLIAHGARVLFFGTVTPQPATLGRLVQGAIDGELHPLAATSKIDAFLQRLRGAGA